MSSQIIDRNDSLDQRSGIIKTLCEAAYLITTTNLHRNSRKDKIYPLYYNGYLVWKINSTGGIRNYGESRKLKQYPEGKLEKFVDQKLTNRTTIGFIAMDKESLTALRIKEGFDPEYLNKLSIGILKKNIVHQLPKQNE